MDIGSIGSFRMEQILNDPSALGNRTVPPQTQSQELNPIFKKDFNDYLDKAKKSVENKVQSDDYTVNKTASPGKPVIDKTSKLYEQCESLEMFLLKTLITGMRNTVQKTGLVDNSFAGKMYEDMLYDEYSKTFSKNANFGLAELAYLELTNQRGKVFAGNRE